VGKAGRVIGLAGGRFRRPPRPGLARCAPASRAAARPPRPRQPHHRAPAARVDLELV